MARIAKKKGQCGTATSYISRKQALKKLQISLKDFRRLCILKGIYPAEPKHKKKANKNNSTNKTYYYLKDIQFLLHEPVIERFRAFKVFLKRLKKAVGKKDQEAAQRIRNNPPSYKLDHIVRERYPAFTDALRDLDDALSMCFLFSTIPKNRSVKAELIHLCRRLTVEFMHYVMETRSLRKVFVSIKGFYYQAEIMGQDITWIVPHALGFSKPCDVDFKIMVTFMEFYSTVLGFVNYRLYHTLNLLYPPKISTDVSIQEDPYQGEESSEEFVAVLNFSLKRVSTSITPESEENEDLPELLDEDMDERNAKTKDDEKLKKLFENCKIFLNREVPRESLVFVIRCFGGHVSYDNTVCAGATFDESDETITHQIVDRALPTKKYLSRYYVQPQWVYDSVNRRCLLPVEQYFVGETLPPHLSPFVKEDENLYNPSIPSSIRSGSRVKDSESDEVDSGSEDDSGITNPQKRKRELDEEEHGKCIKKMEVRPGAPCQVDENLAKQKELAEEKRLAVMMMPKKKKHLYDKIIFGQKRKKREAQKLKEKAEAHRRAKRGISDKKQG